jgi:hypothetical protein
MIENAMLGRSESTRAVAERGRAALRFLERATHCSMCKRAKPSHTYDSWAASGQLPYRAFCEVCRHRRPTPLSPRVQQQMTARRRRLEDAERELAAMRPRRR